MNITKQAAATQISTLTLADYRQAINDALDEFFHGLPGLLDLDLSLPSLDALAKVREYTVRPAKRIRGSLGALTYDHAAGTEFGKAGIALGVALELVQSYLLIIDDVMDRSALRRGEPTVHRLYAQEADAYGDEFESNILAINVGLIAQHLANLVMLRISERPERILATLKSLHHNVTATGFGQIDDIYQKAGRSVAQYDIIRKYGYKSSHYTFINPIQTGLALAGITDELSTQAVLRFGRPAGIAFQLHDDVLGIFGEAPATGKPNVDDLKEGKYTLLIQYGLEHASAAESAELHAMLGNEHIKATDVKRARDILIACGARQFVEKQARAYADLAKKELSQATWGTSFSAMLKELVEYSITRTS